MLHLRLKAARVAKGLTQPAVAAALGVSQAYISKLERGEKRPSVEMLKRLAALYGVSETYLLGSHHGERIPLTPEGPYPFALDPSVPPGLRDLVEDQGLCAFLKVSPEEWRALRSILMPCPISKDGYVQLLLAIRGICASERGVGTVTET